MPHLLRREQRLTTEGSSLGSLIGNDPDDAKSWSDRCCSRELPLMMRRSKSLGSIPRYTLGSFPGVASDAPSEKMLDRATTGCRHIPPQAGQVRLLPVLTTPIGLRRR